MPLVVRDPLTDVLALVRRGHGRTPAGVGRRAVAVLAATVVGATAAAFAWDHFDHGTWATSATAAGVEAALTVAGFVVFGGG